MTQSSVVCSAVIHSAHYFLVKSILKYSESCRNNHNPITRLWRLLSYYLLAELSGTFSPLAGDSSSPLVSLSPCVHVVRLPLYLFHFSYLCEWALPLVSLRSLSSSGLHAGEEVVWLRSVWRHLKFLLDPHSSYMFTISIIPISWLSILQFHHVGLFCTHDMVWGFWGLFVFSLFNSRVQG